jgi:hypothetical protein
VKFSRSLRLLVLVSSLLWISTSAATEPMAGYLMGYFTESPRALGNSWSLHLATSEDGLDWMPLNQNEPVLDSPVGKKGMKDPFFLRKQDGGFVVLATDQSGSSVPTAAQTEQKTVATPNIFVCETKDFIAFEAPRLLKLHDTPMHTLAPEAFFDPDRNEYGILWSGDTDHHRIYINYTKDFVTVSPLAVYFDPGRDVRDATLLGAPERAGQLLYYRDAAAGRLRGTRSPSLAAGSFDPEPYAKPPGDIIAEAPLVVKALHENRWFLYGDSSTPVSGEFHAWQTTDITKDLWEEINPRDYNLPLNVKHPTVIPITRAEMDRLIERWGRPKWHRLKSWNYRNWFVRHETYLCKISGYPFDVYKDSQWLMVSGLADPNGVSFESANFPGYYLRSAAEHVILSKNNGSATFKARATFVKVPGLAESSWSSFRSLSSPDLYLRHSNFFLRLEAVKSPMDKGDATFRIGY